ncbi:hypothetical protein [Rhodococcus zopfii]|uniref:hypothetical protein n=1 Tax=Rhodococcus zopfii TaxID=43772 RepID=UPI001114F2C1|nr:hypothetical protein [Rhodococcus zopfii]
MNSLPPGTVAAVTIGPGVLPMPDNSKTTVVTFDDKGGITGQLSGSAITSSASVGWPGGLTTANASSLTTLTFSDKITVEIDENMLEGASSRPGSNGSLFWFNTAQPDGPEVPYRNNYVVTSPDTLPRLQSVPGIIRTGSYCGDFAYGVMVPFEEIASTQESVTNSLYRMPSTGEPPTIISQWDSPSEDRAFSRTSACSPDGRFLYNIFGQAAGFRDKSRQDAIRLVRIDTETGSREVKTIDVGDKHVQFSEPGTLTLLWDQLFWIDKAGSVYSIAVNDDSLVIQDNWKIPYLGKLHRANVSDNIVVAIQHDEVPTYTEYDLLTGNTVRGPVEISWLPGILSDHEPSSVLSVSRVDR